MSANSNGGEVGHGGQLPELDSLVEGESGSTLEMLEVYLQSTATPLVRFADALVAHTKTGQRLPAELTGVPFISNRRWRDRGNLALYTQGFPPASPTTIRFAKAREQYVWADMDPGNLPPEVHGVLRQVAMVLVPVLAREDVVRAAMFVTEGICRVVTQAANADPTKAVNAGAWRVYRLPESQRPVASALGDSTADARANGSDLTA